MPVLIAQKKISLHFHSANGTFVFDPFDQVIKIAIYMSGIRRFATLNASQIIMAILPCRSCYPHDQIKEIRQS